MTDLSSMQNLMVKRSEEDYLYKDSQIRTLNDNSNSGYGNGQSTFDLRNITDDVLVLAQASFIIPWQAFITGALGPNNCLGSITIPSATAVDPGNFDATGNPANQVAPVTGILNTASKCSFAFKSSALDLISGLNVGLANSASSIVSDITHLSTLNAIKLQVQTSRDFEYIFGPKLAFSKDTNKIIQPPAVQVADTNPFVETEPYDSGFAIRQRYLYSMSNVTAYTATGSVAAATLIAYISKIQCASIIPLHLLHTFLANLDSPRKGEQWKLNLLFAKEFSNQSQNAAFVFSGAIPTGIKGANFQLTSGSAGQVQAGNYSWSNMALKYRVITLPDELVAQQSAEIMDGKHSSRYINFVVQDVYNDKTAVPANGSLPSYQLANGIIKPIRLTLFGTQPGALSSSLLLNTTNTSFILLNVKVGTTNRFTSPLVSFFDQYDELEQQFQQLAMSPDKGSLLTYEDFAPSINSVVPTGSTGQCNYNILDLARVQNRVSDSAVSLQLEALRAPGSQVSDFVVFVERMQVAQISRTANTVTVIVGSVLE